MLLNKQRLNRRKLLLSCINYHRRSEFTEKISHRQIYLDAAQEGNLTIEILDALIDSLNALSKDNPSKTVDLKITAFQFSDLIRSIFDYTIRLAEANNIDPALISKPKMLKKKTYLDLQYYLDMQKSIFEQVA